MAATLDPAFVEREYNNRALVPDHPAYFARWERDSEFVRSTLPCTLDLAYGPAARHRVDWFPAAHARQPRAALRRERIHQPCPGPRPSGVLRPVGARLGVRPLAPPLHPRPGLRAGRAPSRGLVPGRQRPRHPGLHPRWLLAGARQV